MSISVFSVCHRLDRLTSGILVMAKNTEKAKEVHRAIENRLLEKEYVCRVVGEFPECVIIPAFFDSNGFSFLNLTFSLFHPI